MAKLPTGLSGRQVRTALERAGFVFRRQRGSHMTYAEMSPTPAWLCPTTDSYVRAPFVRSYTRRA